MTGLFVLTVAPQGAAVPAVVFVAMCVVGLAVIVGVLSTVGKLARRYGQAREIERQTLRAWAALTARVATVNGLWDEHHTDLMLAFRYPLMTDPDFGPCAVFVDAAQVANRHAVGPPDSVSGAVFAGRVTTMEAAWFALKFEAYRIGWGRLTLPQQHKMRQAVTHLETASNPRRTHDQATAALAQAWRLAEEVAAAGGFQLPTRARLTLSH